MSDLSLFDIERGLHELLDAWQEATTPEAVAEAEQAIQTYAVAEIRKVDGIRAYLRACDVQAVAAKAEAEIQVNRRRMWEARRDRLKAFCFDVMQSFGARKLEGQHGSLSIRGNGGLQPLTITDAALIPFDLQDTTATMPSEQWQTLMKHARAMQLKDVDLASMKVSRIPSNERIRAALAQPCPRCSGTGKFVPVPGDGEESICNWCRGTKTASVPGCRLEARGEHVECR